jgi:hypothetical protein
VSRTRLKRLSKKKSFSSVFQSKNKIPKLLK